jgi:hypothetical protein
MAVGLPGSLRAAATVAGSTAADPDAFWEHRVEPGDTLIGLHERLMRPEADWRMVQRLNRIASPRRLQPGRVLRIPIDLLREQPLDAEIVQLHGQVSIEGRDGARRTLTVGASLAPGERLVTGPGSSASLRFADGTVTLVGPDSRVQLDRHARLGDGRVVGTLLKLEAGGSDTKVPPATPNSRFELQTPKARLGVRGTEFRSRVDGERVLAEVQAGLVAVGPRPVAAGFGTVATDAGVQIPRSLLPPPDPAALPDRIERLPVIIALPPVGGAARYRARWFDAAEPDRLLFEGLFDRPVAAFSSDIPDGRYELRVRGADIDGIEGVEARRVVTVKARPEPPLPLRPRAGHRQYDEAVEFAWSRHPEAARYRVQIADSPDFRHLLVDRTDIVDTELRLPLAVGSYHWRMATVRADGDTGPWGDVRTLAREPAPAEPVPKPPRVNDAGVLLSWPASPMPGLRYQLQVARDPGFTRLVVDETLDASERLLPEPSPGTYHVRVRVVAPDGWRGPFGTPQVVEVPRLAWWLWFAPLLLLL